MHISNEGLIVILLVGVIAGWLAGRLVQGTGFGLVGDLIIGVIGALIGSWLLPQLGIRIGAGIVERDCLRHDRSRTASSHPESSPKRRPLVKQ